jgi:uncharacterized protein (DUF1499 family)
MSKPPRARGRRNVFSRVLLAGLALLLLVYAACRGGSPVINDVSTDLDNPPAYVHAQKLNAPGRDMSYPEAFKEEVRRGYPDLQPIYFDEPAEDVFSRALNVARQTPLWEITRVDAEAMEFEGVAKTRLLRFRDDFIARVRAEGEKRSRVDMRSKSRLGRSDFGANAKRIRKYFDELQRSSPPPPPDEVKNAGR